MQKFCWKRKRNALKKPHSSVFSDDTNDDEDQMNWDDEVTSKRQKVMVLEDSTIKAARLKKEGVILAEDDKWWAAISRWNAATVLQPNDHTLHDMMAQAYMQVGEYVASIKCAEKAVAVSEMWWSGYQTLGRALMGVGEVHRAVLCFSRSLRLHPDDAHIRELDLKWAAEVLASYKQLQKDKECEPSHDKMEAEEQSLEIIDLKDSPEGSFRSSCDTKENPIRAAHNNVVAASAPLKVAVDERVSITESVRFVSCCSSNKNGAGNSSKTEVETSKVDINNMICLRAKLPE
uniref:Tetratricopeptide repeat protein 33-like n=1 Tax=Hirondellea gigas TaxID=1518452 RepID=A0A6A7G3I5_9CRUS